MLQFQLTHLLRLQHTHIHQNLHHPTLEKKPFRSIRLQGNLILGYRVHQHHPHRLRVRELTLVFTCWRRRPLILGDLGAAGRDDAIFVWSESLLHRPD